MTGVEVERSALHDFGSLVLRLGTSIEVRDPVVRYLCAMIAELAYLHIPEWEIEDRRRAKLIPSSAYRMLVANRHPVDVRTLVPGTESPDWFLVETGGTIAVAIRYGRFLFVGFRGTQHLFDWRANSRARLVPALAWPQPPGRCSWSAPDGRVHEGFGEEAVRISKKIRQVLSDRGTERFDHVFLAGHSLGGAVAALARPLLSVGPTTVCVFGAPRFCDLTFLWNQFAVLLPAESSLLIRRQGDSVPTLPPKAWGYVDYPDVLGTDGSSYHDWAPSSPVIKSALRWGGFFMGRCRAHDIDGYRRDIGLSEGFASATWPILIE